MARQNLGIDLDSAEMWADNAGADRVILPEIEFGYSSDYNSSKFPDRRHLNYTMAQLTAIGYDVNRFGACLPWDKDISYEKHAWVTGLDGKLYRSVHAENIFDPNTGSNVPTRWEELENDILAIPSLKIDTEYIPITYHPSGISKSVTGTWIYSLDGFVGAGLVAEDIRILHIWCFSNFSIYDGWIKVGYPDGSDIAVFGSGAWGGGDNVNNYTMIDLPVKAPQNVTIQIWKHDPARDHIEFIIKGATQRTTE